MVQEIINRLAKRCEVVLYYIPYKFVVDIKVSMSSTTLSCCKDINAIFVDLLTEEGTQVLMISD